MMLNRRSVLAGAAAAALPIPYAAASPAALAPVSTALAVVAAPAASAAPDPIFALIDALWRSEALCGRMPDGDARDRQIDRQSRIEVEISRCRPTTLAGLAAQLQYVADYELKFWAERGIENGLPGRLLPIIRDAAARIHDLAAGSDGRAAADDVWRIDHGQIVAQCLALKALNPMYLVLFSVDRSGYAFIGDDAPIAARVLGHPVSCDDAEIGLGVPVVRIPMAASNDACESLLMARYGIAIAQIVEDEKAARKRGREPKRGLVQLVTPGQEW
ncbi:hypothetical protein GGR25_001093 [Kaistia hirudinis]|uniref:DNA mismatch repair protein MutS-like N-terminal domain-containing protein n=1 Tax=Kaistia hirudinis TaxID=1293440 RepID=A0A840ALF4_9HYPH|nr:hypothetical protein [Kaistia hirudinis]MBB3930054.1 hypothetical protein [Kaistia hirudinis]